MNTLDELLKELPSDYDEMDIADHLIKYREQASVELNGLRLMLIETREAWRKTGQPISDIWERGTAILKG